MLLMVAVILYGVLEIAEGVGLWSLKRWGEYVAVVGTSFLLPFEVYELLEKVTWIRVTLLLVNIGAVVYLLWSKRLFGLRGGHEAFQAERHSASVIELEANAIKPRATAS